MKASVRILVLVHMLVFLHRASSLAPSSRPFKIEKSKPSNENNSSTTTSPSSPQTSTSTITSTTAAINTTVPTTSTSSTSTAAPSSSSTPKPTIPPKNATNSTSHLPQSTLNPQQTTLSIYFCECDLKINFCDVDCCCDADCTDSMMQAFTCDRQKMLRGIKYRQGLPSCKMNDGWLCIFKDNSRMKVTEGYNPNLVSTNLPKWPHYFHEEEEHEKDREYYRVGDAVIIYNEQMEETKTLDLPYSLLDTYCHVAEPVRHLKDFTQNCIMTLDDSQNFFTTFIQGLFTHKLLRNRRGFINDKPPTEKSQFIDIGVNICTTNENTKNCQKIQNDTAIPNEGCWKLDIYLHHNFTNLTGIDVFLTCSSENDFDEQDIVSFNVKFLQKNETLSTATRVSGKFGYKVGLPIITGKYVPVVESAEDNEKVFIINYFHNNAAIRETFKSISLPKSVSGACTNRSSDAVNFHENSLTQCSITISNSSGLTADTNYTNVCDALQRTVFHYLINDENFAGKFELHVSELGWPLNISSNWIQIEAKNFENRQVMGSYNTDTNSFRCQNMLLSVRYEFTTARVTLNGVQHQNVVKKVAAEFGNRVDLHFKLEEDLTLPVYMYVMFYDATSSDSPRQCPFPIQLNIFLVTFVVAFYSKYSMHNA